MKIEEVVDPEKYLDLLKTINLSVKEAGIIADPNKLLGALSSVEYINDPKEKVACLIRSMVRNHGFFSGNKRTAGLFYVAMCHHMGIDIDLTTAEFVNLFDDLAKNDYSIEEITKMLFKNKGQE